MAARHPPLLSLAHPAEERCKRGQRPGVSGVTVGRLPYAEPGVILYPGGGEYAVFRDMFFFLEGACVC